MTLIRNGLLLSVMRRRKPNRGVDKLIFDVNIQSKLRLFGRNSTIFGICDSYLSYFITRSAYLEHFAFEIFVVSTFVYSEHAFSVNSRGTARYIYPYK